jgi:hypothetical protein
MFRRPALTLLAPLPVLVAMWLALRNLPTSSSIRSALEFPAAGLHALLSHLNLSSTALAHSIAAALIYLLLALLFGAILNPKKPLGPSAALSILCAALLGCITSIILTT